MKLRKYDDVYDVTTLSRYLVRFSKVKVGPTTVRQIVGEATKRGRAGIFAGHHLFDVIDIGGNGALTLEEKLFLFSDYNWIMRIGRTHLRPLHRKILRKLEKKRRR